MMNADTHQQLARTPNACDHDAIKIFCINCIAYDLLREDFRCELASLLYIDLKRLAHLRMAADGTAWGEAWFDILNVQRHKADLDSDDPVRREAAERARDTLGDYLTNRRIVAYPEPRPVDVARKQMEIVERTHARLDEIERDGSEPDLFGDIN